MTINGAGQKQLDEKLEILYPERPRLGTNVIEAIGGIVRPMGINYFMKD